MSEESDVRPEDALQVAQRALAVANETAAIEDRVEELENEVTALRLKYGDLDEGREYDALTRDEKIGRVRNRAFQRATGSNGRAALDYNDIRWDVFEGEPSPMHCYDLMKWAAEARGFDHQTPSQGNEHLAVDADEAKLGVVYSANKESSSEGRSA
ncbi:hypothetical protein [Halorarum salinum]|uniref:Uncharacterized protein n=1 Tax=Halorarum salinum TaxID=2743089 RepID=A0A7D5LBT4_9EURY|nr:hypothetical protein [Halobaculum salinum]QLG62808.1 hypothetical protein HUG12_14165 [Halobaculum salinum]